MDSRAYTWQQQPGNQHRLPARAMVHCKPSGNAGLQGGRHDDLFITSHIANLNMKKIILLLADLKTPPMGITLIHCTCVVNDND